ncbi:DUF92 domain-containing protein [Soehngenia longivitae]|uniref:DUF92 domain-containing protein n=1 Tax=Soehngenia longivitae TaxID=2562294 RepID=UPI0014323B57|nr:DUF92 domain-containing protein [Soehngenia longivitae]
MIIINIVIGIILSLVIVYPAYKKDSLTISGAVTAVILGSIIYSFGSIYHFIILVSFFISSSVLTKFKEKSKEAFEKVNDKTGKRDYTQVLANGVIGAIFVLLEYVNKSPEFFLAFSVSFAVSTADTWASEIGVLSKKNPVRIITFKPVPKGISGGISSLGLFASFLGAAFISVLTFGFSFIIYKDLVMSMYFMLICMILGFLGSIIDSVLGATVQAQYLDNQTNNLTEKKITQNGNAQLVRGIRIVDNNMVNFLSNLITSILVFIVL